MSTGILVRGLLTLVYVSLYALLFLGPGLLDRGGDLMFQALLHIGFIAFICLTYDILYPYILVSFSASRRSLPQRALGELVMQMNDMHQHTSLDSLLPFVADLLQRLLHTKEPVILVNARNEDPTGQPTSAMRQWLPAGTFLAEPGGEDSGITLPPENPLLEFARARRELVLASESPVAVQQVLQSIPASLALPGHGEQRLLCLILVDTESSLAPTAEEAALLNFFCGQFQVAIERIDNLERVQLRKEAAYKEKMSLMSTLSATIAHEMRTPLSGVRASISGVESHLPDLLAAYSHASAQQPDRFPPLRANRLHTLEQTPVRIKAMVDQANAVIDLLLVNLRDRRLDPATFVRCSMTECVEEALYSYPFKRNERERVECHIEQDFSFQGIQAMMVYVLFNLLKNALYSVEAAGKGKIVLMLERDHGEDRLLITDTGLGIDAAVLPRIFEGFFTTKSDGTGAGLAFCKRTVNNFGGDISVESVLGEYTTFTLSFPRASAEKAAAE